MAAGYEPTLILGPETRKACTSQALERQEPQGLMDLTSQLCSEVTRFRPALLNLS
jgi:hypothetical protein